MADAVANAARRPGTRIISQMILSLIAQSSLWYFNKLTFIDAAVLRLRYIYIAVRRVDRKRVKSAAALKKPVMTAIKCARRWNRHVAKSRCDNAAPFNEARPSTLIMPSPYRAARGDAQSAGHRSVLSILIRPRLPLPSYRISSPARYRRAASRIRARRS